MNIAKLGTALVIGTLSFAAALPAAHAASPITNALVANVRSNIDFLDQSSALAAERSKSDAILAFARSEQGDAVQTAQALSGALNGQTTAVGSADDAGALMTGRSVAIDGPTAGPGQAANGRAPLGRQDIYGLAKMSGKNFNDTFWFKQLDALSQLRADYQAYIDDGDDTALVSLAKRELPKVEARLADLAKI